MADREQQRQGQTSLSQGQQNILDGVIGGGPAMPGPPSTFAGFEARPYVTTFLASEVARYSSMTQSGMEVYVYLGQEKIKVPRDTLQEGRSVKQQLAASPSKDAHKLATREALMAEFESLPYEKQVEWGKKLILAGYIRVRSGETLDQALKSLTLDELTSAYDQLLVDAAGRFAAGVKVTPEQVLESKIRFGMQQAGIAVGEKYEPLKWWEQLNKTLEPDSSDPNSPNFTGTRTVREKFTDIYSPEDTKALVKAVLEQELGRGPTQAEMEDFAAALTAAMRRSPTVRTTTAEYQDGQLVSEDTVTRQGIGAAGLQLMAEEKASQQPGWAEWQAVGTYAPVAWRALASVIPGT